MKLHQLNRTIVSIALSFSLGLLLLLILGPAAHASPSALFTVDTVLDEIDDNVGDGNCHTATGHCSLRAAIMEANNDSGDLIAVPAGTYTLTLIGEGTLYIQRNMTLSGSSSQPTIIQGNPSTWNDTILYIGNNAKVTLNHVTIRYGNFPSWGGGGIWIHHGALTLNNSTVVSNTARYNGGGIYNESRLTVTLSTITGNNTGAGGCGSGIYNASGSSAYVTSTLISNNTGDMGTGFCNSADAYADINFSTLSSNHAITNDGAGILNSGTADLSYITVTNNVAVASSGGILNSTASTMTLRNSFVAYNTAAVVGGVWNDGRMTIMGSSIVSNTTNASGGGRAGGIENGYGAKLTIMNTNISYNHAPISSGDGGGIWSAGPLIMDSSQVRFNTGHYGGGIYSEGGLTLTYNTIFSNSATSGGGIYIVSGGGLIESSSIRDNTADESGGIDADGDPGEVLFIKDSTISGNFTRLSYGGGIHTQYIFLDMRNDTVSGNRADSGGGGIYNAGGLPRLNNVTIANNIGGGFYNDSTNRSVDFWNTLIAGNVDEHGTPSDCQGQLRSWDYNLIQSTQNCVITGTTTHNITGTNPLLGPLQNNGGPSWTQALLPNSPAIDAGSPQPIGGQSPCEAKDQRGISRPVGLHCDIGAYEAPISKHVYLPAILR